MCQGNIHKKKTQTNPKTTTEKPEEKEGNKRLSLKFHSVDFAFQPRWLRQATRVHFTPSLQPSWATKSSMVSKEKSNTQQAPASLFFITGVEAISRPLSLSSSPRTVKE